MTNKEAIEIIKAARAEVEWEYPMEYAAAFDKAIEALEQEPILDKIRAEINAMPTDYCGGYIGLDKKEVLQVIDKYKAEVKSQESEGEE